MVFVAVGLDDEAVRRPVEVDLEARVVRGFEDGVGLGLWQACGADEVQDAGFEVAAGVGGLVARGFCESLRSSVAVGSLDG